MVIVLLIFPLELSGYRSADAAAPLWYFITETGSIPGFLSVIFLMILYLWNKKKSIRFFNSSVLFFFAAVISVQVLVSLGSQLFLKNVYKVPRPNQHILIEKGLSEKEKVRYFSMPEERKKYFLDSNLHRENFYEIYPRTFESWMNDKAYSFPSGHAQTSFFAAVIFSFIIFNTSSAKYKYLSVIPLIWAVLVSLSRVIIGFHYPSDVIAGACIGLFSGLVLVNLRKFEGIFN